MKNGIYYLNISFFVVLLFLTITNQFVFSINANGDQKPIKILNNQQPITDPQNKNTSFSLTTAFEHLMYSFSTYCLVPELSNWTCPYCTLNGYIQPLYITQFLANATTNTFGFIGITADNSTIVISFRGTQLTSLDNWITNLNFPKTKPYPSFSGALVHEGFYEAYAGVSEQLISGFINTLKECPLCTKLIVTGHSLGGALAIFASLAIYENSLTDLPLEMYTFGSPRVGDIGFVDYYESIVSSSIHRCINSHDIVPHLAPLDLNFYHLPQEVWFNETGNPLFYKICNYSGEDPTCSDSLDVALSVEDHLTYLGVSKDLC